MLTTPHPTRIIVTHAHYSAGIHSGKRTFEKNKIKKKKIVLSKSLRVLYMFFFFLFFGIWIKFLNIEFLHVLNCIYSKKILTIHIIIITCSASLRFCFSKNKKIQFWIVSIPWVVPLTSLGGFFDSVFIHPQGVTSTCMQKESCRRKVLTLSWTRAIWENEKVWLAHACRKKVAEEKY